MTAGDITALLICVCITVCAGGRRSVAAPWLQLRLRAGVLALFSRPFLMHRELLYASLSAALYKVN